MGYGLLLTYGVFRENPGPPSWWTEKCMGYRRLWVIKSMGYGRFDCTPLVAPCCEGLWPSISAAVCIV